jgi:hypothetical protein
LLLAVVVGFAYGLQVLNIPEQLLVAVVWYLVVNDWAVGRVTLTKADHTSLLASVSVTLKNLLAQLLPSAGLVPLAMLKVRVTITVTLSLCLLPRCGRCCRWGEATAQRLQPWLKRLKSAHISRYSKGDR